ncbi:MAG: preprotein translocase subunit SecG [Candidatus Krumholzibacteria bacterium]|nr:preprotein translocase subunit SecG [Candidatus Krumholzibacteria bacterium]
MLFTIILVVHILGCVLLTVVVLMQSSRGGALSAAFGGSSGQIFGGRETATFLSKATQYLAILFFLTSLSLAFLSTGRGAARSSSALRRAASQQAGTIVPEEQKNIQDVLGNVPQPGQSAEQGAAQGTPQEGAKEPKSGGK